MKLKIFISSLLIIGYFTFYKRLEQSPKVKHTAKSIPELKISNLLTPDEKSAEILAYKSYHLSRMVGAAQNSDFSKVADAWYVHLSKDQNLNPMDKKVALGFLKLMRSYQNHRTFGVNHLSNIFLPLMRNLQLKKPNLASPTSHNSRFWSFAPKSEKITLQNKFWKKAERKINQAYILKESELKGLWIKNLNKASVKELASKEARERSSTFLFDPTFPIETSENINKPLEYMTIFEVSRLNHKLDTYDQLFATIIENNIKSWVGGTEDVQKLFADIESIERGMNFLRNKEKKENNFVKKNLILKHFSTFFNKKPKTPFYEDLSEIKERIKQDSIYARDNWDCELRNCDLEFKKLAEQNWERIY